MTCARAAHEANRAYCSAIGDDSQKPWEQTPRSVQDSAKAGVRGALEGATAEQIHESWLEFKRREGGWRYGPVKDLAAKVHPCFRPYGELPAEQRAKDELYLAVVRATAKALGWFLAPAVPPAAPSGGTAGTQ